jgi:type I phosphodiesterase/nucleotide pyrophosphatase
MTRGPQMVVVCVDGGVPSTIADWNFFSPARRLPGGADRGAVPLRSVFPSSTAPAHASFLTGGHPDVHGIIGNRFWATESVAEIRRRASDPVQTLHPYEANSLTAASLVSWLTSRNAKVVAVQFPQTFSRTGSLAGVPSIFCLYAQARCASVAIGGPAVPLTYFGEIVPLEAQARAGSWSVSVRLGSGAADVTLGETVRITAALAVGEISVAITCTKGNDGRLDIFLGTAVLTMRFGLCSDLPPEHGPSSLAVEYSAAPGHDFHEAPRAEWIARTTLDAINEHEPDVIFVRFNQADHAQEYLYWHAARGEGAAARLALDQILDVYHSIDQCLGVLMSAIGPDANYVVFSDHGIDYVELHLRPNVVLGELGLNTDMIFQGDSNLAFLYADRMPSAREVAHISQLLAAADPTIQVIGAESGLPLPWVSARMGRLVICCGPHREFVYDEEGPAREKACSASHGYLPSSDRMNGFFRAFGPDANALALPGHLVSAASFVKDLWSRSRR